MKFYNNYFVFVSILINSAQAMPLTELHSDYNDKIKYINSCIDSYRKINHNEKLVSDYCNCSINQLFSTHSESEISAMSKTQKDKIILEAKKSCSKQFTPKIANIWTPEQKKQIFSTCLSGVKRKQLFVDPFKQNAYCECYSNEFCSKYTPKNLNSWNNSELIKNVTSVIQYCQIKER